MISCRGSKKPQNQQRGRHAQYCYASITLSQEEIQKRPVTKISFCERIIYLSTSTKLRFEALVKKRGIVAKIYVGSFVSVNVCCIKTCFRCFFQEHLQCGYHLHSLRPVILKAIHYMKRRAELKVFANK